jgi:hypothetical protein
MSYSEAEMIDDIMSHIRKHANQKKQNVEKAFQDFHQFKR